MIKVFYRFLINWYQASDKPLPAWLERACQRDPDLSSERDFGNELTVALKKRPNESTSTEGASMASRVLRQITEEDYVADKNTDQGPAWGVWLRSAGMGVAALAVAVAGFQLLDSKRQTIDDQGSGTVAANIQTADKVGDELLSIGEDWKNPLDQEIEYIVSDAKGAIGFLATSFVPSGYLKKIKAEEGA